MRELILLYMSWFKMGLFTFGGGYAMLPMIQKEVVEKYKWASEDEIMDYYAIGQCTPGIIAVNTATFVGYKVKGVLGGVCATLGVVSPSLIIISIIAACLGNFQDVEVVAHALAGIKVSVCVLMAMAIYKLAKKSVKSVFGIVLCIIAFVLSYFTSISTVILVLAAGICGLLKGSASHE